jgi:hypothetical protein
MVGIYSVLSELSFALAFERATSPFVKITPYPEKEKL